MIPLPRRGGGGVERGGDACIALGGACLPYNPHFVVEPFVKCDDNKNLEKIAWIGSTG